MRNFCCFDIDLDVRLTSHQLPLQSVLERVLVQHLLCIKVFEFYLKIVKNILSLSGDPLSLPALGRSALSSADN